MSHASIARIALLGASLSAALAAQSPPALVNYQGRLTDNGPTPAPVTATVSMRFAIHDAASGGVPLWFEPASGGRAVAVTAGLFSVMLGADTPVPASVFTGASSDRWLEITLNPGTAGEEILAPRQRLGSQGYAALAQNANNAASASVAGTATSSAQLGGIPAASWQRALGTTACPANQYYTGIAQDGSANCAAAVVAETDPKVGSLTSGRIPRWGGAALADGAFHDTGSAVGLGAAPGGGNLLDLNGSITQSNFGARLLRLDGTLRSDPNGQAYLYAMEIAPTYNFTQGYGNYAAGLNVNPPIPSAGSQTVHSIASIMTGQPTGGASCNVAVGINVPNQNPSLCNGRYGFYQYNGGTTQYNYFGSNVGIGTPFPGQRLVVSGGSALIDAGQFWHTGDTNWGIGRLDTGLPASNLGITANALVFKAGESSNQGWMFRGQAGNLRAEIRGNDGSMWIGGGLQAASLASRYPGDSLSVAARNGTGSGGTLTIDAGDAGSTTGGAGGNLALTAGDAMPLGGSGYTNQGPAGTVTLTGGGGYNGVGGNVTLASGPHSPWTVTGDLFSRVTLQGGALNAGDGAALIVEGGHNVAPAGTMTSAGGSITLTAGNANGAHPAGNIVLTAGAGTPNGRVQVNGPLVRTGSAASISVNGLYCGSTAPTTGAVTSGPLAGYRAAKALCETACGSAYAHMCDASEIVRSLQTGFTGTVGMQYWYATGNYNASAGAGDCAGFTSASPGNAFVQWTNPGVTYGMTGCGNSLRIACCL